MGVRGWREKRVFKIFPGNYSLDANPQRQSQWLYFQQHEKCRVFFYSLVNFICGHFIFMFMLSLSVCFLTLASNMAATKLFTS